MALRKSALDILFGSPLRTMLMRFFLLNPETVFTVKGLAKKTKTRSVTLKKEIAAFLKAGFIKKATAQMAVEEKPTHRSRRKKSKRAKNVVRHVRGFSLDPTFPFLAEIRQLFLSVIPQARQELMKDMKKIGKLNVIIASGIFLDQTSCPVDLLLVGERVQKQRLETILKRFEHELGKDIVYAVMPTAEFEYRANMNDRFLQDILSHPHEMILDALNILENGRSGN